MITVRRLSDCSFTDALTAWNNGFIGYRVQMEFTMEMFVWRMGQEGMSPRWSVIAYDGEVPVGIICSGIREIGGKKVGWNGGTGVAPDYRKRGVGRQMMLALLELYREEGVELATLEALSDNAPAIGLYESLGYRVVDQLQFLHREEPFAAQPFAAGGYRAERRMPPEVVQVPFYEALVAWQSQWGSVKMGGEAVCVYDGEAVVGYALYRRAFDAEGQHIVTNLFQCVADPEREDGEAIYEALLGQVFAPHDGPFLRRTFNLTAKDPRVIRLLEREGFTTFSGQVFMTCELG